MLLTNQYPAAFQSLCACLQPHRSACVAAASSSCLVRLLFFPDIFFSLHPLSYLLLGLEFPWGPKPFAEVVAGPLLRNNRQTTDSSSLEGHYVGVYFSAHWVSRGKRRWRILRFFFLNVSWSLKCWEKNGYRLLSRAEQEETVETDKRREQEGGEASIVFVCFYWQQLTIHVSPFLSPPLGPL